VSRVDCQRFTPAQLLLRRNSSCRRRWWRRRLIGYKVVLIIQGCAETIENAGHHTTSHIFALEDAHRGIAVLLLNHLDDQVGMDEGVGETYNLEVPSPGIDLVGILLDRVGQAKRGNRRSEGIVRGTHFVWGEGLGVTENESVLERKKFFLWFWFFTIFSLVFSSTVSSGTSPSRTTSGSRCRSSPTAPPPAGRYTSRNRRFPASHTPRRPCRSRIRCWKGG
jgi:hypothetical protein